MLECQICHIEYNVEQDDGIVQPDGSYICKECCNDLFDNAPDEEWI